MDIKEIKLRRFKKGDSLICSKIIYDCADTAKKLNKKEREYLKKIYTPEKIIKLSKKSDFFVIEKNHKVIGTIRLEKGKIATFYIKPKWQKKGIGTLAINFIIKKAKEKKLKKVYLSSLLQSVGFYEKQGFKKIKPLKKSIRSYKMKRDI